VLLGASSDGGHTWSTALVPFSRCTGGDPANGGDFERASDPWVSFSPSGIAYALALVFSGETLAPGSSSAMRVARSADGGASWSAPQTLIADAQVFNDKGSITADPTDTHFIYAVWDRLTGANHSATTLARSTDGGTTWETARAIYDPGSSNQTLGNIIVVLPDGTLEDIFTEIDTPAGAAQNASLRAVRSSDHGVTWSAPIQIAEELSIGAYDPNTGIAIRDGGDLCSVTVDSAGVIHVVWQDARFSGGLRDGVAMSRSTDGGLSWTAPVQINAAPETQAFVPIVAVRADGIVGVTYYDFRNNTSSAQTLLTDYWIVTTSAANWTESHITGPFDLDIAPEDGGLFLGDYQSLGSVGTTFLPFFAKTNAGDLANRTDIFVAFSATVSQSAGAPPVHAASAATPEAPVLNAEWQRRIDANIERVRRARFVGRAT
jgi:hypothetical protein